jgi:hypothetical protein
VRAEFRANGSRLRVDGTSSLVIANAITIHDGTITGPILGTAIVAADGTWAIDLRPGPNPTANSVTVESSYGNSTTLALTRR